MTLDIEATFKDMARAASGVLAGESRRVRRAIEEVLEDQKEALRAIAEARLAGDIDDDEVAHQIRSERLAFRSGLAMVRAVTKASVQKAANAAFAVFIKALKAAL